MDRKKQLEEELKRIVNVILTNYKPERLILFGSLANNKVHEWSDIDLAVVKTTNKSFIDRIGELLNLIRPKVGLNILVYTPKEVKEMETNRHYFWLDEIIDKGKVLL